MTDLRAINDECKLIALLISRGDASVAQPKINKLIANNAQLSGNIRLTITNHLLDLITNPPTKVEEEATP